MGEIVHLEWVKKIVRLEGNNSRSKGISDAIDSFNSSQNSQTKREHSIKCQGQG